MAPSPPPHLAAFLDLYAKGEFWESHEVLEGPWRSSRSDFLQGLILYASAWVHWQRENAHGVQAQLRKTLDRFEGYPAAWCGIDVERIRRHCRVVRSEVLDRGGDWVGRVAPLSLSFQPEFVRGDEPELENDAPE